MKRLACLALVVLTLAGCDSVSSDAPTSAPGHRDGFEADTYRDAQNLTHWCENNGLCLPRPR